MQAEPFARILGNIKQPHAVDKKVETMMIRLRLAEISRDWLGEATQNFPKLCAKSISLFGINQST